MKAREQCENLIKLFGMTNQLVVHDLSLIEDKYQLSLGHAKENADDRDQKYYPQFDEHIRKEAASMARHYEIFYCLEKSIRSFVSEMLQAEEAANWWDSGRIPQKIHQDVSARMMRELDAGITRRSDFPIDYTNFGELSEIIKANWDVFGSVLNSQKAVERVMGNLNTIRNPIAHCSLMADDEIIRLQLSMRDWFRLMEQSVNDTNHLSGQSRKLFFARDFILLP